MPAGFRAGQTRSAPLNSCRGGLDVDQGDEHVFEAGVVLAALLAQFGKRAFGDRAVPAAITPIRSAMRSATSRICVVMITVQPVRTRSPSSPLT